MKKIIIGVLTVSALFFCDKTYAQETSGFCATLKTLMEAAKDTFITVKGPMIKENEAFLGKEKRYEAKVSFPDADSTYILKDMKIRHVSLMASDSFHSSDLVNKYYELAEQVNTCLGSSFKYEEIKDEINQVLMYKVQKHTGNATDMQEANVYIKLDDSGAVHKLTLEIDEPFFKRKKSK